MTTIRVEGDVKGHLGITPASVYVILDGEARKAVDQATNLRKRAIRAAAPKRTGRLVGAHKARIKPRATGYRGYIERDADAFYGRIVEDGRHEGTDRIGRHVGAMRANPFVTRATRQVEAAAWRTLERGADRAQRRIEARLNG